MNIKQQYCTLIFILWMAMGCQVSAPDFTELPFDEQPDWIVVTPTMTPTMEPTLPPTMPPDKYGFATPSPDIWNEDDAYVNCAFHVFIHHPDQLIGPDKEFNREVMDLLGMPEVPYGEIYIVGMLEETNELYLHMCLIGRYNTVFIYKFVKIKELQGDTERFDALGNQWEINNG